MDQLPNNLPTSERFTAEQVRKFLGLNDDYSNSSSSSSSDCENDNLSDISLDINTNESQNDEEDIIPPSLKRGKRTENKSVQKIDGISKNQAGKHNISTTSGTSNPLYKNTVSVQYQTSGSTQSLMSHNILAIQQNQHQHVEIETPTMTNHVEHNLESVIFQNAVPQPVFTIDLGIQIPPGSPLQNGNNVQIIHNLLMRLMKMYNYRYHFKIIHRILLLFKMELPSLQILFHRLIHIINSHIHLTLSRILYHQMLKTLTIIMKYKLNFQIQTVMYNSHQLLITQGMKF